MKHDKKAVMLKLNIKGWEKLLKLINEGDLYNEEGYGLETEPHVTILYGISPEISNEEIKLLLNGMSPLEVKCLGIEAFYNDEYDVLKITVEKSEEIMKLRKILTSKLYHVSSFDSYEPHITIAYLKKGEAEKYINPKTGKYFICDEYWISGGKEDDMFIPVN